jgi:WD40 repeat protein
MNSDSVSAPQHATLAISSGSKVTLWNCVGNNNNNNNNTENDETTTFDPFLPNDPSVVDLVWNHTGKVICCVVETQSIDNDIIALLSAQSGRLLSSFGKQTPIQGSLAAAFGGKSRYLCMGTIDGGVLIWDLKKQAQTRRFKISSPCLQVCLDPTDAFVLALNNNNLSVYRLREAKLVAEIQPPNDKDDDATGDGRSPQFKLSCFTISSQAPYLTAVGSHSGRVWIYDLSTITLASNLHTASSGSATPPLEEWKLSSAPIVKLDFVGALNRLVVASDNHVGVYEYPSCKPLFQLDFDLEMKRDQVTSMSCKANLVAVGQASGKVMVWDWELKTQVASFDAHAPVQRVAFAPHAGTTISIPVPVGAPKAQPVTHQPALSATGSNINNDRDPPQTRLGASPDTTQHENPTQLARQENVVGMDSVQDMIRDEVDRVREDMQDAFRNLHVDMLRQFQMQSQDLNFALAKQLHSMERLSEENRFLREENRSLQQENDSFRNR